MLTNYESESADTIGMVKKTPGNDDTKKNEADKEDITKIKVFADKLNKNYV